jgi:ribosome-associated protein
VAQLAKEKGLDVLGIEQDRSWVLVDLYDVIVHIMLQETREFYSLEKLWEISADRKQHL